MSADAMPPAKTMSTVADGSAVLDTAAYRELFRHMLNGMAYCRMEFEGDRPVDFIDLATNPAFETQTGLRNVVGKRVSDDFGAGYSSLSYLKRFPINVLKIDQTFMRDIPHDNGAVAIADTIIAMARDLHMHVLAEGVETPEQLDYLRSHGCGYFQGYLYSRPVPAAEMAAMLRR